MNWWIEEFKKFHSNININDIHISDLINDTKSKKVLQYTGDIIEENFDGIYTYDIIEKLPKKQILEILKEIYTKSDKFVYLGISTIDGVEPIEWWIAMIEKHSPKKVYTHIKTYGNCNNYEILNEDLYLEFMLENL